jgi:hypothetical protein
MSTVDASRAEATGVGDGLASDFASGLTEVSTFATTCPTFTVSPSATNTSIFPASSALSVSVALSESISAITSSFSTMSPVFFTHRAITTSVIDSPGLGTFNSTMAITQIFIFLL